VDVVIWLGIIAITNGVSRGSGRKRKRLPKTWGKGWDVCSPPFGPSGSSSWRGSATSVPLPLPKPRLSPLRHPPNPTEENDSKLLPATMYVEEKGENVLLGSAKFIGLPARMWSGIG
jgi:hypothetical protein